jgi:outer membrane biosynthesis protein TonB
MRAGWVVSFIGHIGFVLMTMLAWEARTTLPPAGVAVVPIEIVDIAPESNVRALAMDVPEDEAPTEQEPSEAEPEPAPAPTPTPQRPRPRNDEFDLSAVAGLLDKQREPGRERVEGQRADRNQRGAGLGTAEVASLRSRAAALMERAMERCWRMPVDQPDYERLVVVVEFDLDRNGNLRGAPRVTSPTNYTFDPPMRVAVENAMRAIRTCEPFPHATDPLLAEHYEIWGRLTFNFDPADEG